MNVYIRQNIPNVTTAWIYHSSDLWLISISSDWENWTTFEDKNLWASTAGTTSSSYWDYYCWWSTSNCNWQVTSSYTVQEDWSAWTQSIAKSWFHIPTTTEFTNLVSLYQNLTWKTTSADLQSDLMFPLAWQKLADNTTISYAWTWWYMWAKEKTWSNGYFFRIAQLNTGNNSAKTWFSVRLFKDSWYTPTTDWDVIYDWALRSYSKIISMSEQWQVVLAELNNHPADYYNKLNSEWHIINSGIADSTGQAYQNFNDWTWSYYFMLYINWVWALEV